MEALGEAVFGGEPPPSEAEALVVEQPKDASHGDMATNAAMVLARPLGRPPRELAEAIQPHLAAHSDFFESVEVAGPGFINFRLAGSLLRDEVRAAVAAGPEYGRSNVGQGRPVQVEFVSANPTGPLHVGHGRGAAVGDVLASLLEAAGFAVHREYYINDVGTQMELLGRSTYSRYSQALGRDEPLPEDGYHGAYLVDIARQLVERDGPVHLSEDPEAFLPAFTAYAAESILRGIEADLRDFGVHYDQSPSWSRTWPAVRSRRAPSICKCSESRRRLGSSPMALRKFPELYGLAAVGVQPSKPSSMRSSSGC